MVVRWCHTLACHSIVWYDILQVCYWVKRRGEFQVVYLSLLNVNNVNNVCVCVVRQLYLCGSSSICSCVCVCVVRLPYACVVS